MYTYNCTLICIVNYTQVSYKIKSAASKQTSHNLHNYLRVNIKITIVNLLVILLKVLKCFVVLKCYRTFVNAIQWSIMFNIE